MNFSRIPRDVSRALFLLIRSRLYSRAAGTRMRQHPVPSRAASAVLAVQAILTCSRHIARGRYEDAVASSTVPRGLGCTCGTAFYDLQSADFLCFIIRKLRLALIVCIGFTNAEYRIAIVDFIVALRRTKGRGRRTLRSPPSPSSGLHLIHPGLSAAAGHFGCRWFIPI